MRPMLSTFIAGNSVNVLITTQDAAHSAERKGCV